MSSIACIDAEKRKRICAAELKDNDQGSVFFCPGTDCKARMFPRRLSNGHFCFYASRSAGHIEGCYYTRETKVATNGLENTDTDEIIESLMRPVCKEMLSKYGKSSSLFFQLETVRTLRQLYSLLKASEIKDRIGNYYVGNVLIDNRSDRFHKEVIGKVVIEAEKNKKLYDRLSGRYELYLHHYCKKTGRRFDYVLVFEDEGMYKDYRHVFYNRDNPLIVVAGDWEKRGTQYYTQIVNRKQIIIDAK